MSNNLDTNLYQQYDPSDLRRFLAWLAGYDLRLLPKYAGEQIIHEENKLVRLGASLLIPSIIGFFTALYFFSKYINNLKLLLLVAIVFSLLLLLVDCIIVATLSKANILGFVIRLLISICVSIVISEPALLYIYEETINFNIDKQLNTEKATYKANLAIDLNTAKFTLSSTDEKLNTLLNKAEYYSEQNITKLRHEEAEERRNSYIKAIVSEKTEYIKGLNGQVQTLETRRNEKNKEIEDKLLNMEKEYRGERDSRKPGYGAIYGKLKREKETLENERDQLDRQIKDINKNISNSQKIKDEDPASLFKDSRKTESSSPLTDVEKLQRDQINSDILALQTKKQEYNKNVTDIENRINDLETKFVISNRDDPLSQTLALYNAIKDNSILLIKVLAFLGAFFFFDILPVFVKLTTKTGYDDYIRYLNEDLAVKRQPEKTTYYDKCIEAEHDRFDKLSVHSEFLTASLSKTNSKQKGMYPHEKILHTEAHDSMRFIANLLRPAEQHETTSPSWFRPFGIFWSTIKVSDLFPWQSSNK